MGVSRVRIHRRALCQLADRPARERLPHASPAHARRQRWGRLRRVTAPGHGQHWSCAPPRRAHAWQTVGRMTIPACLPRSVPTKALTRRTEAGDDGALATMVSVGWTCLTMWQVVWRQGREGELSSPEALLARILERVPQPVWVVDHPGFIVF